MDQGASRGDPKDVWAPEGGGKKLRAAAFVSLYEGPPPYLCNQCPVSMRPGRGCTELTSNPVRLDPRPSADGSVQYKYVFDLCPVNYVPREAAAVISLWNLWKQGKMLETGGVGEQPAKYVDIMIFMDGVYNRWEREQMESKGVK